MKLWKKILIGVVILAAIGVGIIGYGFFKVGKAYTEKLVPDMIRYTQMTTQEQDQYVISHMEDLLVTLSDDNKNEKGKASLEAVRNDPAVRQAGIAWGRSLCASIITNDKDISAKLTPEAKEKYRKEASDSEEKSKHFQELLDKAVKAKAQK